MSAVYGAACGCSNFIGFFAAGQTQHLTWSDSVNDSFQHIILTATGAHELRKLGNIQSLWSGYGSITRYGLRGGNRASVVVKHVILPDRQTHPRGWNTDFAHQRKVHSYQVESNWYQDFSSSCDEYCVVPHCLAIGANDATQTEFLIVMEDLDASGFPIRNASVTLTEMQVCLQWLAHFHATFMGRDPAGLWPTGTYWHLATRPDELNALTDKKLKTAAPRIDRILQACPYQTLVHGDAKLANFCFSNNGQRVAAVDFQYVGGGCGMKDVAYFISSCLSEEDCERYEIPLLDYYFEQLKTALAQRRVPVDVDAVESAWRPMYAVAWTDFYRFLQGWSPGHWKLHSYSERLAREVLHQLECDEDR